MNKCIHKISYPDTYQYVYNDWTGSYEYQWVKGDVESTCRDIDLHRYICTQCGEVGYYSEAARKFYEEGIEDKYIKGLGKNDIAT